MYYILQHLLHVLHLFCDEKLLNVNVSKTQVVIFNDFRHAHTDEFLYSDQNLTIAEQYTYLGIVLHKSGSFKAAIEKLAAAGKRALFAMQYRCSDLGLHDPRLRCSLFSSLVQPVLSYGCEVWGLEKPYMFQRLNAVHTQLMKRTLQPLKFSCVLVPLLKTHYRLRFRNSSKSFEPFKGFMCTPCVYTRIRIHFKFSVIFTRKPFSNSQNCGTDTCNSRSTLRSTNRVAAPTRH